MKKILVRLLIAFALGLFFFYIFSVLRFNYSKANIVSEAQKNLFEAMENNRTRIRIYFYYYKDYPVLKSPNINFWDFRCNQYIWSRSFEGINNVATNPFADGIRAGTGKFWDRKIDKMVPLNEELIRDLFFNPLTGKFDWLAEDANGNLYSSDMPNSVLLASPPIRVVNIRCPLTVSDPPFFEDFTKW